MPDNAKKDRKDAIIGALEKILSELDEHQLFLPALKIVEALDILSEDQEDTPTN
ncbi:MAG: hypothetical protein ABJF89_11190 [Parasphingorhabdus sp.]|uniref:hypothetical protein n=1 Tax=Parasphingorhabdus sp. TaxID=2709688 RepID=UPI0032652789